MRVFSSRICSVSLAMGLAAASLSAQPKADPQMQAVLDALGKLGAKPVETLSVADARKQPSPADAVRAVLKAQGKPATPEPVANVANRSIEGPGGAIALRIYTPSGQGPFPVVFYIHGGGWVIATLDT